MRRHPTARRPWRAALAVVLLAGLATAQLGAAAAAAASEPGSEPQAAGGARRLLEIAQPWAQCGGRNSPGGADAASAECPSGWRCLRFDE